MFVAEMAEVAYRAYGDRAEWKNHLGRPMPQWAELPENIRSYWGSAVSAVLADAAGRTFTMPAPMCQCGHAEHFHDVAEADGSGRRCCMTDCTCGDAG